MERPTSGRGERNLLLLLASVGLGLMGFYGFLGYRALFWTPALVVFPTTRVYAAPSAMDPPEPAAATGRGWILYGRLGCAVCHGLRGRGGVKNPNAKPDQAMPDLLDLAENYTPEDLRTKLADGAHVRKKNKEGSEPIDMPAWNRLLGKGDMDDLCDYLFTLKKEK